MNYSYNTYDVFSIKGPTYISFIMFKQTCSLHFTTQNCIFKITAMKF